MNRPSVSSYIRSGELESYIEEWRSQIPNLTGRVSKVEKHPVAFGGFSDIWSCVLERSSYLFLRGGTADNDFDELETDDDPMVAVKAVRIHAGADEDGVRKCKRLFRETEVWKRLKHPNILPLFGVTFGFGPLPALVCPWMDNGTITAHLDAQQDQLSPSDRWGLLSDTISGLNYLHSELVVHGDLSGSNILIDRYGHARLADFGLSTILLEFVGKSFFTSTVKGSIRWAAPELFCFLESESTVPAPSQASDIYSFGSIVFQVLTGEVPYSHLKSDVQVIFTVSKGMTPPRPASSGCVSEPQWKFIQQCWSKSQTARPTSIEVAQFVDSQYLESVWNDER
ncbi:kinase-like protein [Paxillus ammoniavirescens]|nr:kinase-like protein [Paxillus ammoniavirescens]